MVLKPEPIFAAVEAMIAQQAEAERTQLREEGHTPAADGSDVPNVSNSTDGLNGPNRLERKRPRVILMCPQGEPFTQAKAEELAQESHLILVCGHYEGYDERIREHLVTDELSIGDYVLTGGELPAMVVTDSVVRLLPGVLGNESSAVTDSFSTGLLEYPHYTRPADFRGWMVPDVLLSGHHAKVEQWRKEQSLRRTVERRSICSIPSSSMRQIASCWSASSRNGKRMKQLRISAEEHFPGMCSFCHNIGFRSAACRKSP